MKLTKYVRKVLIHLYNTNRELYSSKIARDLGFGTITVDKIIRALEKERLIKRKLCLSNKKIVELTPEGVHAVRSLLYLKTLNLE